MGQFQEKFQKIIKNILNKSGKDKILIVILTGVLLLIVTIPTKKSADIKSDTVTTEHTSTNYEEYIEDKLENILSKVDGVGKVKVVVTLKDTGEKIIAQDENNSSEDVSEIDSAGGTRTSKKNSTETTNIYYGGTSGDEPYVKNENMPEVEWVMIVAQGGGDGVIAANITSAVESLLGVPVHKIKVLKMS